MIRPLFLALCFALALPVFAQDVGSQLSPDQERAASEAELQALQKTLEQTAERQRRLTVEIERLDKDKGAITRALIETGKRTQDLEKEIAAQETKLQRLSASQTNLRKSLLSKRALLSEVLAALQRMGKNPPPAILVTPEDAVASVRSAILLGAVVPEIRSESATLLAELRTLAEIARQIDNNRQTLAANLNKLAEDETRLTLLLEKRDSQASQSRQQLEAEKVLAEELASKATSLQELITQIEAQIESANKAAAAAKAADAEQALQAAARLQAARKALANGETVETLERSQRLAKIDPRFADNNRIAPAMAFSEAKGLLPQPVSGRQSHTFGTKSTTGITLPNVGFITRPNARVRAPADGWVVYAGPFRSYGSILILNTGGKYRYIMSGMSSVNVRVGQFVLTGEPIGQMGLTQVASATALDLSTTQPVLYVELRKDGKPVDPTPWWRPEESEKVERNDDKGTRDDT